MEIRRLGDGDHAILALAIETLIPEDERGGTVASEAHLKKALAVPSNYFIVCLIDSSPVGYLSAFSFPAMHADRSLVYLYDVVVAERCRRNGIGSDLIEELKNLCRSDGVDHIWLGTSLENHAGQRTFMRTGGQNVGETYIEYVYPLR